MVKVVRKDFEAYEGVRKSGDVNMFLVSQVCTLSGLDKEKVLYIMENYRELKGKWEV